MKKLIYISLLMLITSSAWAVYIPGLPKALMADYNLQIEAVEGIKDVEKASATIYAKDGEVEVTSLTVDLKGNDDKKSISFTITDEEEDFCGSTIYHGENSSDTTVMLVDHSTRHCEDYKPFKWQIEVNNESYLLEMSGNPQAVINLL